MFKNKKMLAVVIAACVLLVIAVGIYLIFNSRTQNVLLDGYTLMVPKTWETVTEDNSVVFKNGDDEVGRFSLLYKDHEVTEVPKALGYEVQDPEVRESDQYATKVYEVSFREGEDEICQYIFDELPDMPPYQAVLTFKNVSGRVATRVLQTVSLPKLGGKVPEKPIEELTEEFLEHAVYTACREEDVYAFHLSRLDRLIQAGAEQPADEASALHILSYEVNDEGEKEVKSWYYISAGGGEKRLYTYEKGEEGTYFYRNNPKLIREITRESSAEENYTRYYADGDLILEAPYNVYAENKDALFAYKDTTISNNSNVSAAVKTALPAHVALEGIEFDSEGAPYGLKLSYVLDKPDAYVKDDELDETAFYQNALMLFSLVTDVDRIQMEIRTGETVYSKQYERAVAEKQFDEESITQYTVDEKKFEEFTEEVPKIVPPSQQEPEGSVVGGTRAVTSRTVVVSSSSKVRHPKTGQMVSVKPYAERYGVAGYLDKPITVTLYEKNEAGKITMWATATCGGAQLGSYPISSVAEFNSLVGMAG